VFRTVFLDGEWFSLETASTLIANHSGLLHAPQQAPAEPVEPVDQQQQQPVKQGKQKQAKQLKQRDQSPSPAPVVPLSAIETAAAALSGTVFFCYLSDLILAGFFPGTTAGVPLTFSLSLSDPALCLWEPSPSHPILV